MHCDHISRRLSPNIPELWKDEAKIFYKFALRELLFSVPNDSRIPAEMMGLKLLCCRRCDIIFYFDGRGAYVPCLLRKAELNTSAIPYIRHAVVRRTFFDQKDAEANTMPKPKWLHSC
jgi:hypothetical protein